MNAEGFRSAACVALMMVSALTAQAATPMPACAELDKASAADLTAYLERDRKSVSGSCVEFAIRQLAVTPDRLSISDSDRAIGALMPYLDFPRMITGKGGRPLNTKWYPAKITIVGATNSSVQRLEDAHRDWGLLRQRVLDKLIGVIADPTASAPAAESAAWAVDEIMAYPNSPTDALPAVQLLAKAARASADASSSPRLRDEARRLAETRTGDALWSQCDAALN